MTPAEIELFDRHAAIFRSDEFIKKFAAVRLHMRRAGTDDRLADEDEMAKALGVHPSAVRLMFSFVDAFDISEKLIETAELLTAPAMGAPN